MVRDHGNLFRKNPRVFRSSNRTGLQHRRLAAIISPVIVGMIADRFFSANRVLAFLNIVELSCFFPDPDRIVLLVLPRFVALQYLLYADNVID